MNDLTDHGEVDCGGPSPERIRAKARRLLDQCKAATNHESRARLSERAFELAQRAEQLEREL